MHAHCMNGTLFVMSGSPSLLSQGWLALHENATHLEHGIEGKRLRSQYQLVSMYCTALSADCDITGDRVIKQGPYIAA